MKILLAADGSRYTRRAVAYVLKHLDMLGGKPEVHLLHVEPPLPGRAAAALTPAIVRDYYRTVSRKAIAPARRAFARKGITCAEIHRVGDPGAVIAEQAGRGKFDLVVMGSRGHGAVVSLVLGSVVCKVLANCSVPALIVR